MLRFILALGALAVGRRSPLTQAWVQAPALGGPATQAAAAGSWPPGPPQPVLDPPRPPAAGLVPGPVARPAPGPPGQGATRAGRRGGAAGSRCR